MSTISLGIYLTLWNRDDLNGSPVLQTLKSGYPHVTLLYAGKHLHPTDVQNTLNKSLNTFLLKDVTLTHAEISSFTKESTGEQRHDVLCHLSKEDKKEIEAFREKQIRNVYKNDKLIMRDPHVTSAIFSTRKEAEDHLKTIQALLPYKATIVGATVST